VGPRSARAFCKTSRHPQAEVRQDRQPETVEHVGVKNLLAFYEQVSDLADEDFFSSGPVSAAASVPKI
jgi:hypothetical protein